MAKVQAAPHPDKDAETNRSRNNGSRRGASGSGPPWCSARATTTAAHHRSDGTYCSASGATGGARHCWSARRSGAPSLGLEVIAEGVENLRQMRALRALGCSIMQGFLFSRPLPPDDLELWLRQTLLPRDAPWIEQ